MQDTFIAGTEPLENSAGVGHFRVDPRFHPMVGGQNLGLTWEFPTPKDGRDVPDTSLIPPHPLPINGMQHTK